MLTKYIETNEKRLESNEMLLKNQSSTIKNLVVQLGQIHNILLNRSQETLPSNTETNPRDQLNAVTLTSGTKYDGPKMKEDEKEVSKEKEVAEEELDKDKENMEWEKKKLEVGRRMKKYEENDSIFFTNCFKKQA